MQETKFEPEKTVAFDTIGDVVLFGICACWNEEHVFDIVGESNGTMILIDDDDSVISFSDKKELRFLEPSGSGNNDLILRLKDSIKPIFFKWKN